MAYYNAAKQEAAGEPEKAELFREAIPFYEASISSCQEALNSFRRGEKELAELQQEFQSYPFRIGVVYEFAAYEEVTENLKKAGLFRKAIPFYQEALRLGQESLESFKKGNMELATSQQALAREQDKLGGACFNAAKQQRSER